MDILKHYIDLFNSTDEELYRNAVDNAHAYEWLQEEIPLFECPDKDLERTYYFRYWTYRKHLKSTEDGYVISEFLPDVSWAGKHNTINAALGFHLYEGRWLKNAKTYLSDYVNFFFDNPKKSHKYSTWFAESVLRFVEVTGDIDFARSVLPKLCAYDRVWDETNRLENGLYWSIDDRDAMEYSISGTTEEGVVRRGIRPTLNSYLCADARAIATLAKLCGEHEIEEAYRKKHEFLKQQINEKLFEDGFYRAYHYDDGADIATVIEEGRGAAPRELLGYIPWMFCIPESRDLSAFDLLRDPKAFYSKLGPTTAEASHPRFLYEADHECLWNGYVWPFATAQTLYAIMGAIDCCGGGEKEKSLFCDMMIQYAKFHERTREDGVTVPWIDEVRHPVTGDWSSRTWLAEHNWHPGGVERGKDYNHSAFCDLVIRGIVGVKAEGETLEVHPCIPSDWEWFRLSNLHFRGKTYTVTYDKTGAHYGIGQGLTIAPI